MSTFSERFRELKEEHNLTLKELSEKLNITVPNLSYYMKGREPSYDILIDIANYFSVSTDWLVGRTHARTSESLDIINIIEEENGVTDEKLSGKALKNYMVIQDMLIGILSDLYVYFQVASKNDDFLECTSKELKNLFLLLIHYVESFAKFIETGNRKKLKITKENVTNFLNDNDLIADTIGAMLIIPTLTFANFMSQVQGLPEEDYKAIHSIIDFVSDRLDRKYPQDLFDSLIEKLNNMK